MQAELESLDPRPRWPKHRPLPRRLPHSPRSPTTRPQKIISFQKHDGIQPSSAGAPWFTAGVKKTASPQKVEMPPKPAKLSKEAVQRMLC